MKERLIEAAFRDMNTRLDPITRSKAREIEYWNSPEQIVNEAKAKVAQSISSPLP